jgi:hypothetical protein
MIQTKKYIDESFKALRCKGNNQRYNSGKDYLTAKQAIDSDFTNNSFTGLSLSEIEEWEKTGGWVGWLIPEGVIGLDVEDREAISFIENFFRQINIEPSVHLTNKGKHYLLRLTKENLPGASTVYTKSGVKVTYRVGNKNYLILAPTNGRSWEKWKPVNELPYLPKDLHPYEHKNKDEVLRVLSWQIGECLRSKALHGYDDIDTSFMVFLIDSGLSEEQIHNAFQLVFLNTYDWKRTQMMYERAKQKLVSGDNIRGAGTFFHRLHEYGLKNIESLAKKLKQVTDVKVEPLITDKDLISVYPFPFDIFPQELQVLIKKISDALHVEPEIIASAILTITSGAIGNSIRVSPKQGYEVAPFIWLIIIALSGYGKSPIIQTLLKHIKQLQAKTYNEYQKQFQEYERELKRVKKEDADEPVKPKLKHYLVSDCTVEALANVFDNDGRGPIIYQDEIAGLILGLDQYKGKGNDKQHYHELFNCGSLKIDRKLGVKFIHNTGASIIGGIQPKVMPKVFNADSFDDGLLPRFLLLNAENRPLKFSRQAITQDDISYWIDLLNRCYEIPLEHDVDGFIKPKILILSSEALDLWEQFYNDYGDKMPFLSERARVFIPKLTAYYSLKFAGILHVIRAFDKRTSLNSLIDDETTHHAIELTHYFAGQAIRALKLYEQPEDTLNEFQKRLIEMLHRLQGEVDKGRLAISRIREVYISGLSGLSGQLSHRKIGAMVKELGLKTEESTGGVYYLIWELEKIQKLFSKYMSTMSTISTKEEEKKTNLVDFSIEKNTNDEVIEVLEVLE